MQYPRPSPHSPIWSQTVLHSAVSCGSNSLLVPEPQLSHSSLSVCESLYWLDNSVMPYFYEEFSRKALLSLTSTYKDIIAYLIFYSILIIGFAVAATQLINLAPGV